jgi:two-component system NarL family sensor kinase
MAARTLSALVAGGAVLLAAIAILVSLSAGRSWADALAAYDINAGLVTFALALEGALVMRDQPGNRLGRLLAVAGLWGLAGVCADVIVSAAAAGFAGERLLQWITGMWFAPVFAILLVPLLYPHGRPLTERWRTPTRIAVGAAVVALVGVGLSELAPSVPDAVVRIPVALALATLLALSIAGAVGQLRRLHSASADERRQTAWLLASVLLVVASLAIPSRYVALSLDVCAVAALGIGIVRYRLFEIESVLSRAAVYLLVVVAAIVAALVVAAALGQATQVGLAPTLAAAGIAVALAAVYTRLVAGAERLLFGQRRDPMRALGSLGDRLAATVDPAETFPTIAAAIAESLRLPYAAVVLAGHAAPVAEVGAPVGGTGRSSTLDFAMEFGGRPIAALRVGLRRGEREMSTTERQLLERFAQQAAAAANSALVTRDLRLSRERIVSAREEERRSLRRDLHDGVGPGLAGLALGLEVATKHAQLGAPDAALLGELHEQAVSSLESVRELTRDLRPSVLDEIGLVEALRQRAQSVTRFTDGRPSVSFIGPDDIPDLPAAVEVAAYRIAQEALSNVTRHAGASQCRVTLEISDDLVLDVTDDGNGCTPMRPGVGLDSMRERADELGGACTVTSHPGGGTTVRATLPLLGPGLVAGGRGRR